MRDCSVNDLLNFNLTTSDSSSSICFSQTLPNYADLISNYEIEKILIVIHCKNLSSLKDLFNEESDYLSLNSENCDDLPLDDFYTAEVLTKFANGYDMPSKYNNDNYNINLISISFNVLPD